MTSQVATVPAVRSSARQRERKHRRELGAFLDAISLIEANRLGLLQREVDRATNRDNHATDANLNTANTEDDTAERAPLSDRVPPQSTDDLEVKGKLSSEKPTRGLSRGKVVKSNTKNYNPTLAASAGKEGNPSTSAKKDAAEVVGLKAKQSRVILRVPDRDISAQSKLEITTEEAVAGKPSAAKAKSAKRPRFQRIEDTKAPAVGKAKRARTRK